MYKRRTINKEIEHWGKKYIKEKNKTSFLIANLRNYMYDNKALKDIPCPSKISRALILSDYFEIERRKNKPSLYHYKEEEL